LVALANNNVLDAILTNVFMNKDTIFVGFGFHSHIDMLAKHLTGMQFFKHFANFIDLQKYYEEVFPIKQSGLAKVAEHLLKKVICLGEQMSNWERRPLRLSQ
jgi:hypothetical protein